MPPRPTMKQAPTQSIVLWGCPDWVGSDTYVRNPVLCLQFGEGLLPDIFVQLYLDARFQVSCGVEYRRLPHDLRTWPLARRHFPKSRDYGPNTEGENTIKHKLKRRAG